MEGFIFLMIERKTIKLFKMDLNAVDMVGC
jgi:hypothetical protein